jgi:glutaminyl-peptide cyclotransferase
MCSILFSACGGDESNIPEGNGGTTPDLEPSSFEIVLPEIEDTLEHDATMFTQGLCFHDGDMYETSGRYGSSRLRRIEYPSMEVVSEVVLPPDIFAEGIAVFDDTLCMLTWREGVALRFTVPDLGECGSFSYQGEGWGLTCSDSVLYMSDGSATISVRDPSTFELLGLIRVRIGESDASFINELEYDNGLIYANQWGLGTILEIDAATGRVLRIIDSSDLLDRDRWPSADVLNGIALDPEGRLLVTGKLWPSLYRFQV